jgi:hypothetical protein
MNDYRYPFITASEPAEKLRQIESYLRQLVDKLNAEAQTTYAKAGVPGTTKGASQSKKTETEATFDEIKSLIIKSADVVDSIYEKFSKKLSGTYVAQSEFGKYTEYTSTQLEASSDGIKTTVESQEIIEANQTLISESVTVIEQSVNAISLEVTRILTEGVDKVITSSGYTFNEEGLRIQREGQAIENLLNNLGMYVYRSGDIMLKADASGVEATDVKVNNYLIVGDHARFEDYTDGSGSGRTACFYVTA